ncbi:MAG: hypothetical protein ACJ762_06445 [Solirubrobacteraceae bacterium]
MLAGAITPTAATAGWSNYFSGLIGTGVANRQADGSRDNLNASYVASYCSTCRIWAGAHYAGGTTLYASWAEGYQIACHNYGTPNIGAMIEAPYVSQYIDVATAGINGTYCP